MTIRTFVQYVRVLWSGLGIGVAKDKITLGPSDITPSKEDAKNCGAASFRDMENPWLSEKTPEWGAANPWVSVRESPVKPNVQV